MAAMRDPLYRINNAYEFAEALKHVVANSDLHMNTISTRINKEKPDLISWLLSPLKEKPPSNAPKKVNPELAMDIAQAVAGEGRLKDAPLAIWHLLMGVSDDPASVLRSHLRPVGMDGATDLDSPESSKQQQVTHLGIEAA